MKHTRSEGFRTHRDLHKWRHEDGRRVSRSSPSVTYCKQNFTDLVAPSFVFQGDGDGPSEEETNTVVDDDRDEYEWKDDFRIDDLS